MFHLQSLGIHNVTIAHSLTLSRIFLTAPIVLLYLHPDWLKVPAQFLGPLLLAIFLVSELSDAFDGYFARKLNQVTELGALIDPLADSVSRLAIFFTFTRGEIAIAIEWPLLMLGRELVVSTLRTICALRGLALAARNSGKLKAIVHSTTVFAILGAFSLYQWHYLDADRLRNVANYLVAGNACFSLATGIEYLFVHWSYIRP